MKKLIWLAVVLLILVGGVAVGSLVLVNSDWFRGELERVAGEKLNAKVTIGSIQISGFSGRATVTDAKILRDKPDERLELSVGKAVVKVSPIDLVYRKLTIDELHLESPAILTDVTLEASTPTVGGVARLKEAWKKTSEFMEGPSTEWYVGHLKIDNATVDATVRRPDVEPTQLKISKLDYEARDVSVTTLSALLVGSSFNFEMEGGGSVRKKPGDLQMKEIDLATVGRIVAPSDSLRFSGGMMNLDWKGANADLKLRGTRVSGRGAFLLVPVDKIRKFFDDRKGNVDLTLKLEGGADASPDLRYIVAEMWNALWESILHEATPNAAKTLQKEADKLKGLLDKVRRK